MTTVWRSIRISSLNHYAVTNCSCARALEARLGGAAGLLRGSLVVVRSGSPMLVQVLGASRGGRRYRSIATNDSKSRRIRPRRRAARTRRSRRGAKNKMWPERSFLRDHWRAVVRFSLARRVWSRLAPRAIPSFFVPTWTKESFVRRGADAARRNGGRAL